MQKTCLVCGNIFSKKYFESSRYFEGKKYCSLNCSLAKTSIVLKPNYNLGRKKTVEEKLHLSKVLMGRKGNKGSFKKGSIPWTKGKKFPQFSGPLHPNFKERQMVECTYCKKSFQLVPWQMKNRKRFFCNRECWAMSARRLPTLWVSRRAWTRPKWSSFLPLRGEG